VGLADLTSEILVEMKMDASQPKRELQELKNFQSALGEEEGKRAAERNTHLGEWVERLGKVTLAVVAIHEVSEFLWDGWKDGVKDARLATQAIGVDLEKLTEATRGLIAENDLLAFAAKANHSAFKNSQQDIENAGKAIIALEHRGVDAAEAMDAVTRALVEGKTKGLEPYGIVVDKHIQDLQNLGEENLTLAQKTEIHTKAMQSLKTVADEVSDSQDDVGDSMQRSQVKLANAWDDIKKELGKLVIAFQPVIEALAKVLTLATSIAQAAGATIGGDVGSMYSKNSLLGRNNMGAAFAMAQSAAGGDLLRQQQGMNRIGAIAQDLGERFNSYYVDSSTIDIDKYEWKRDEAAEKKAAEAALVLAAQKILRSVSAPGRDYTLGFNTDTMNGGIAAAGSSLLNMPGMDANMSSLEKYEAFRQKTGVSVDNLEKGQREMIDAADLKQVLQYAQEFLNQKTDSVLEKTFGPVGQFDLYKKGFESLTGGIGRMYEAVVSGSESGIGAFQKFIAAQVAAEGKLMMVEAVKEGAYAIGNLAYGNFAGAAAHAQAAAEFAAGAVLAGVVASELGYGGGGGSSGPGRGSSGGGQGGGGSGGGDNSRPIIISYGDSFAEDSPRSRQTKAAKLLGLVTGTSGGKFS